jgi:hypothetical protein
MAYSSTQTSSGVRFLITPPRWPMYLRAGLIVWTGIWISFARLHPPQDWNSRLALGGFAVITISFGCQWVWNMRGREVLDFASDSLIRRRFLFRFSRVEHFQMSKITNPRFVGSRRRAKGSTPSGLGFLYENRSFRIGDHLSGSESKSIAFAVAQAFPEHATVWQNYDEGIPDSDRAVEFDRRRSKS